MKKSTTTAGAREPWALARGGAHPKHKLVGSSLKPYGRHAAGFSPQLLTAIFSFLLLAGSSFAMLSGLTGGVSQFCTGLMNILPIASMLMVIVGAVVYASGQIMGAETRARANVWATTCLTGALVGILIVTVAPPVLTAVGGTAISCSAAASCTAASCAPNHCCSDGNCHTCCVNSDCPPSRVCCTSCNYACMTAAACAAC